MIAESTYRALAVKGSEQYGTTANGHDQIVVDFDLPDIGEKVSVFLFFSEKAAPYSIKKLRAAGWRGNDLSNLDGLGEQECVVRVSHETYNGEQKMKTDIVVGGTITLDRPLDDKGKKAFAARFKSLAASAPSAAPAQKKTGTDDIDF